MSRAERAPGPGWGELLLTGALLALGWGALLLASPPAPAAAWSALRVASLLALPWRRRRPVAMVGLGFGLSSLGAVGQLASASAADAPDVTLALLLLPYALGRRTSGRGLALGVGLLSVCAGASLVAEGHGTADVAGAAGILATPLALGVVARTRAHLGEQALEQAQLDERHRLGRQLDDAVAHRLATIAVRAQTPPEPPERALEALRDIEAEAARCLAEMRGLVRRLREDDDAHDPQPAPQASLPKPISEEET